MYILWMRHCTTIRKVAGSIPDWIIKFFIHLFLPAALWLSGWIKQQLKCVPGISPGEEGQLLLRANNVSTFTCRLSRNSGNSASWSPEDLSRPVQELLYIHFLNSIKPRGNYKYNMLQRSENLNSVHRQYLRVSYDSHDNYRLFP